MYNCTQCGTAYSSKVNLNNRGVCGKCINNAILGTDGEGAAEWKKRKEELLRILVTTESVSPFPIQERLGIVTAECVLGMNLFKDFFTGASDVFGGRSQTFQDSLRQARETAIFELRSEAHILGADAVVAIPLNYSEISGGGKSMLFLVAAGTAVRIDRSTTS